MSTQHKLTKWFNEWATLLAHPWLVLVLCDIYTQTFFVIPLFTVIARYHGKVLIIWHSPSTVNPFISTSTDTTSKWNSSLHLIGNGETWPFSKHSTRCLLISSNFHSERTGSRPWARSVAHTSANTPQSQALGWGIVFITSNFITLQVGFTIEQICVFVERLSRAWESLSYTDTTFAQCLFSLTSIFEIVIQCNSWTLSTWMYLLLGGMALNVVFTHCGLCHP